MAPRPKTNRKKVVMPRSRGIRSWGKEERKGQVAPPRRGKGAEGKRRRGTNAKVQSPRGEEEEKKAPCAACRGMGILPMTFHGRDGNASVTGGHGPQRESEDVDRLTRLPQPRLGGANRQDRPDDPQNPVLPAVPPVLLPAVPPVLLPARRPAGYSGRRVGRRVIPSNTPVGSLCSLS